MEKFDVVVIGAGPGGYVAAIRCAQLGLRTAVVERWINKQGEAALGGTCLNVGCIPSKALLESSEQFHRVTHKLAGHGIHIEGAKLDLATMLKRKDAVVRSLTGGVETLFLKHKITWFKGTARMLDAHQVEVTPLDGTKKQEFLEASHIILATGSVSAAYPNIPFDDKYIVDSTGALDFPEVPKQLVVIGAGVIGLELGSAWQRLGSDVVILNRGSTFLSKVDQQIAREAQRILKGQGLDIRLGAKPTAVKASKKGLQLTYTDAEGEKQLRADRILIAIGRKPQTEGLNLEAAGVAVDEQGFISVDGQCRTAVPHIYAVGDVVRGPMLAHKASEEGIAVAERIVGQAGHVNYNTIPWVIYTWPEIAWVGKTTEELQKEGRAFKAGVFPFMANGRAHAMHELGGMVKVIADAQSDKILGVHMIGPHVSELIAEVVVAMEFDASSEDLARIVHAHPTLSEAIHEAALAADGRVIHI